MSMGEPMRSDYRHLGDYIQAWARWRSYAGVIATVTPITRPARMRCLWNGAAEAGLDDTDPRFDCNDEPMWHLLLTLDVGAAIGWLPDKPAEALLCEGHVMKVYDQITMRHRAGEHCARGTWRLATNDCGPYRPTIEG